MARYPSPGESDYFGDKPMTLFPFQSPFLPNSGTLDMPSTKDMRWVIEGSSDPTLIAIANSMRTIQELIQNEDQALIAKIGVGVVATLMQKNHDYGSSVFQAPATAPHIKPEDAILVRLHDKMARLKNLQSKESQVKSESVEDTIRDVIGYWILYLVNKEKELCESISSQQIKQ